MAEEPLQHIIRTPLPWRDADKTVCGRPVAEFRDGLIIDIEEARAMAKRLGTQRFARVICMTCASHAQSWVRWEANPIERMAREVTGGGFGRIEQPILHELRAIATLVEAHRAEFDRLVAAFTNGDIVVLGQNRPPRRSC